MIIHAKNVMGVDPRHAPNVRTMIIEHNQEIHVHVMMDILMTELHYVKVSLINNLFIKS